MDKIDIKSLTLMELEDIITGLKMKNYRAKQIFDWIHNKQITDFSQMTNISAQENRLLKEIFCIKMLNISKKLVSGIDNTVKYLYALSDKENIETVFMRYKHGSSLCLSTQAGCRMGCKFCASSENGFGRNLFPSEILEQVYMTGRDSANGEKINNIVLMGIGEPLDNYDNVIKFLQIITDIHGYNMSMRNISLSTCGLADKIYDLADLGLQITLSISLHAPNDGLRSKIMPVNKKFNVNEIIEAGDFYAKKTRRRITFEYAVINGFNDSEENAAELSKRLKGILCHVNLIPVNKVNKTDEQDFLSDKKSIINFRDILLKNGINATVRRTLGADIEAACGQLRRKSKDLI